MWEPRTGLVQVWCRILSDAVAADPARDPAGRSWRGVACWWTPCSTPPGPARPCRTRPTTAATRSCELPEPAEVLVHRLDGDARHAPARRPPRRDRRRPAAQGRPASCASRPTRACCATAGSPTCARSATRWSSTASPIARTDGRHGTGEIAELLAPVSRLRALGSRRADALRRRRHDLVRRGGRRARRARAGRGGRQRRRRPLHERRPDHDGRRRRDRRGRGRAGRARGRGAHGGDQPLPRDRARTCTSACAPRASGAASPSPRTARSCRSRRRPGARARPGWSSAGS